MTSPARNPARAAGLSLAVLVASLLLLLLTPFVLLRTPTDIFPSINIPVVSIVWQYAGLDAQDIEQRINFIQELSLATTVTDIEHIESNAYNGMGVIKVFFREGTSVDAGVAQVTAIAQTVISRMPPGTTPPLIIRYSASTVPILQYSISSPKLSEQEIFDLAANQLRVGLATVQGAAMPWPYGGKNRIVAVDLDLAALKAKNLAPMDVVNALNAGNLILPSGTTKIGGTEYAVELNATPKVMDELGDLRAELRQFRSPGVSLRRIELGLHRTLEPWHVVVGVHAPSNNDENDDECGENAHNPVKRLHLSLHSFLPKNASRMGCAHPP